MTHALNDGARPEATAAAPAANSASSTETVMRPVRTRRPYGVHTTDESAMPLLLGRLAQRLGEGRVDEEALDDVGDP